MKKVNGYNPNDGDWFWVKYTPEGDPKPLKEAYEQLKAEHTSSEWTKRVYPYRLL